jgi:DNA polymerase-3 subunit delta'
MNLADEMDWLSPQWNRLGSYIQSGRVPQALLLVGREGVGKTLLAETFAKRLLCRTPSEYACGVCASCRLFAAKTHPDFLCIEPEEKGKAIPVDAIRGLIANLALKPQYSGRRVVLIVPAHQMNVSSANSLLKTLEEPDEHTSLLLLTDSPQSLPATILSRCQRMDIPVPERKRALEWLAKNGQGGGHAEVLLALARGAPVKALGLANDGMIAMRDEFFSAWCHLAEQGGEPATLAEKWAKFPCETLADWMISWTMDMIRLRAVPRNPAIDNPDLAERLLSMAHPIKCRDLFRFLDRLNAARKMLLGQINRQLLLEEILILWLRASHPKQKNLKLSQ